MTAQRPHEPTASQSPRQAHSRREAEIEEIVRVLRSYGALTRTRLGELCGAAHWTDSGFKSALRQAVASGRVRRLGDDLYEVASHLP